MDSPFTKATETRRRLKVLMYGPPKVGKTLTALALPKPVAIDLEHGTDAYAGRYEFDVLHTVSAEELKRAIDWLAANRGQYQTVIIDPITVWYEALQQVRYDLGERKALAAKRPADNIDIGFGDWKKIKLSWNVACARLVNAGYHFVAVARQAWEYEGEGQNLRRVGFKPGADTGAPYWFDTIVRLEMTDEKRFAHIEGDRWNITQGRRVLPLDEFVEIIRGHAVETLNAPVVEEPDPEQARLRDVEQEEKSEQPVPATSAPAMPVSPEKQKVPCPRGCGGWIVEKTVQKTGAKFYGCSNFQTDLKCRATMTHKEYDIATGGTGEKPAPEPEAEKPAPEPEAEPDLAIDTIWRQTWREMLVPLSLGEDAVRHDLGRLFDGDLDRMPAKNRKRAIERMKEMAAQVVETDPFANQG